MSRLALFLVAAQLAAISAPCPVAPIWQQVEVARAISAPPPCPGHGAEQHAEESRSFMVFRCPCGCSDGLPPASGVHHSRAAVLPAAWVVAAPPQTPTRARGPALLAPQHEPPGIRHVPRAA